MLRIRHPRDRLFVQRFPTDMKPADELSVTVSGVTSELLDTSGPVIRPPKRQQNQKRQERFTLLEMEFGQKVIAHELRIDLTTAEIFLVGQIYSPLFLQPQILVPRRSTLSTYYERKDKRKLLHVYFQKTGHPFLKIERVLEGYDRVLCIDTNTATNRKGQTVAVTIALVAKSTRLGEIAGHIGADQAVQVISHDPPPGNPELHGIWEVLRHLVHNNPELVEGKIAIITDTEYGKVKAWHERTEPFFDGHMLPDGVDIFYATADAGSEEFMPNMLMRACDSLCAKKLREVLASAVP